MLCFVAVAAASSGDMFFLTLRGNCSSTGSSYLCLVAGESQQTATVFSGQEVVFAQQPLGLGVVAAMTLKGTNPTPWQFEESGVFVAGTPTAPNSFNFAGSGTYSRSADGLLTGAGGYNVTGTNGFFAGRVGRMTALNHGREADHSFRVHLVVQLSP